VIDARPILAAGRRLTLSGAPRGLLPWLMAELARAQPLGAQAVFIAEDEPQARALAEAARLFAPELRLILLPAWDCLPYDRASPSARASADRLAALARLARRPTTPRLVVTTLSAAIQRTLTRQRVAGRTRRIEPGTRIDRDQLAALLAANGYVRTDTVVEAGEFAVRGGLIDLFPAGERHPIRLDFFGDEIETLRRFDVATQRSIEGASAFVLLPVSEALLDDESVTRFRQGWLAEFGAAAAADPLYQAVSERRRLAGMEHWLPLLEERLASLFDWLGEGDAVVLDEQAAAQAPARFAQLAEQYETRRAMAADLRGAYRPLPPERLYLAAGEWEAALERVCAHRATGFEAEGEGVRSLGARPARDFAPERAAGSNVYDAVAAHLAQERREKRRTILACFSRGARERLAGLLADHGVDNAVEAETWQAALGLAADGRVPMLVAPIERGFTLGRIGLLTEQDMLGERLARRRRTSRRADAFMAEMGAMQPGDLVVHADHGIGRFEGLQAITAGGASHDCVALAYEGGDRLYVPVENIDVLSRYGAESEGVALDRLGGVAWQARKARMAERIKEIADELIRTAAARAARAAEAHAPEPHLFAEFVNRFPYAETDDQLRAIEDVLADLASGRPMDRLVCGDVGFGKTEVALRAAYAVAMSGRQVAVVCPTTLLARQHYAAFRERFQGLPVNVRPLSRLVPAAEAKAVREGLASGTVDIVVGTHALLAKGISFDRLGLVVVDEEQRFGVVHKERLKALRTDVHVLTLTATPIPRTLQMAMSGLRELSIIATPPVDRLAVRTHVMPWDPAVIREALLRERARGGQSFLVTPRIADMPDLEAFLREAVPEVSLISAHGQMAAGELEDRMGAFYERRADVLLSTSIVESGIDIPSANTLIVHRADLFGLAQLYQLRGRVGRAKARAFAYFTTPEGQALGEGAQRRLHILSSLDSLGAGFQLASHDLDLRGAGNLLGDEQSGHIREVGFELYQQMLEEAIATARAGEAGAPPPPPAAFSPQIAVEAPILLPEDYVADLSLRLGLYKRLGAVETKAELEAFAAELIDRFGPLPEPAANLVVLTEIKLLLKRAGVAKLDAGPKGALVAFRDERPPNPEAVLDFVAQAKGGAKLRPDGRLFIERDWARAEVRLPGALQVARLLAKLARGEADAPAAAAGTARSGPGAVPSQRLLQPAIGAFRSKAARR
jgi:transcription-repair coupling factor (superfamily II helicase)